MLRYTVFMDVEQIYHGSSYEADLDLHSPDSTFALPSLKAWQQPPPSDCGSPGLSLRCIDAASLKHACLSRETVYCKARKYSGDHRDKLNSDHSLV